MNGYDWFARYYDRLTDDVGYPQRAAYVLELLREHGGTGGLLLDLACGTGSLSIELAKAGFDVIGVDASPEMLMQAREKAARAGVSLLLLAQEMPCLDLYGTVDAAVCTLDSLNHLVREEDMRETLRRVSLFLNPGGLFIFDVNTPYKHREILGNHTFIRDLDDLYCIWQNQYDEQTDTVVMSLDFFARDGECYRRSEAQITERAYSDASLTRWLERAGFLVEARYAELSHQLAQEDTQRVFYVARKTGEDTSHG